MKFIFSNDIIPVFIGICIYREGFTFSNYNIEYLKRIASEVEHGSAKLEEHELLEV